MVQRFGCNPDTAEDIVQDMYLKIKRKVDEGVDIMFSETEVNYYYIYKTLNSIYLDTVKKERMYFDDLYSVQISADELVDFEVNYEIVRYELDNIHWYNKMVYQIIEGGENISALSKKTKISYYSLYNTYNKVKEMLKLKLKHYAIRRHT